MMQVFSLCPFPQVWHLFTPGLKKGSTGASAGGAENGMTEGWGGAGKLSAFRCRRTEKFSKFGELNCC